MGKNTLHENILCLLPLLLLPPLQGFRDSIRVRIPDT